MQRLFLLILLFFTGCNRTESPNWEQPIAAREAVAQIERGWNLGNTLEAYRADSLCSETSWHNPLTTQWMIDSVRKAGFNAVRVPVRWYPHFIEGDATQIDPAWLARVKEVVGYCLKNDMQVIVNTHHERWIEDHPFYRDTAELFPRFSAFWHALAQEFEPYDYRLMLAATNEVHEPDNWNPCTEENGVVQNRLNQLFVDAVRATGGRNRTRNLVVQTYCCNATYNLEHFVTPNDPTEGHLSVEFHYYDPVDYTMFGKRQTWGTPYSEQSAALSDEEIVARDFERIAHRFAEERVGIILGEYGAGRWSEAGCASDDPKHLSRRYYYEQIISTARRFGIATFVWDNGNTGTGGDEFGLFKRHEGMRLVGR